MLSMQKLVETHFLSESKRGHLIMKTIIIQEHSRHKENIEYRECMSLKRAFEFHGHEASVWGLGHSNYQDVPDWNSYDLIINIENYDETGWVPDLSSVKTTKFIWAIDAHCKGLNSYLHTFNCGKYDLILQSTPEFLNDNSVWFPNCYDDDLIKPLEVEKEHDIGFCGTVNNRGHLIDSIDRQFGIRKDIFVLGDSMVRSINSYKIHFNANISIDINYRNFETIGCGTCLLTSYNRHYETLGLRDKVNCLIYSTENEMLEKIETALNEDDFRKNLEISALELAKYHTYKNRIKIIEEILK